MKPLILPCVLDENRRIVISKEALDSLIDKAYEAGVEDGRNMETKAVRIIKEPEEWQPPITTLYAAPYPGYYSITGGDTDV